MATDRYTKLMLTIIATALLYLCALHSGQGLSAQGVDRGMASLPGAPRVQPVIVVGWGTYYPKNGEVEIHKAAGTNSDGHSDATLPVRIENLQPLPVNVSSLPSQPLEVAVTAIRPGKDWEPIRTKVEMESTRPKPGGGMLR